MPICLLLSISMSCIALRSSNRCTGFMISLVTANYRSAYDVNAGKDLRTKSQLYNIRGSLPVPPQIQGPISRLTRSTTQTYQHGYAALGLLPPGPHPFRRFTVHTVPSHCQLFITIRHGVISFQQAKQVSYIYGFIWQLLIPASSRFLVCIGIHRVRLTPRSSLPLKIHYIESYICFLDNRDNKKCQRLVNFFDI